MSMLFAVAVGACVALLGASVYWLSRARRELAIEEAERLIREEFDEPLREDHAKVEQRP